MLPAATSAELRAAARDDLCGTAAWHQLCPAPDGGVRLCAPTPALAAACAALRVPLVAADTLFECAQPAAALVLAAAPLWRAGPTWRAVVGGAVCTAASACCPLCRRRAWIRGVPIVGVTCGAACRGVVPPARFERCAARVALRAFGDHPLALAVLERPHAAHGGALLARAVDDAEASAALALLAAPTPPRAVANPFLHGALRDARARLQLAHSRHFGREQKLAVIRRALSALNGAERDRWSSVAAAVADGGECAELGRAERLTVTDSLRLLPAALRECVGVGASDGNGLCMFNSVTLLLHNTTDDSAALALRYACVLQMQQCDHLALLGVRGTIDVFESLVCRPPNAALAPGYRYAEDDVLWLLSAVICRRIVVLCEPPPEMSVRVQQKTKIYLPVLASCAATDPVPPTIVLLLVGALNHYVPVLVRNELQQAAVERWACTLPVALSPAVPMHALLDSFCAYKWATPNDGWDGVAVAAEDGLNVAVLSALESYVAQNVLAPVPVPLTVDDLTVIFERFDLRGASVWRAFACGDPFDPHAVPESTNVCVATRCAGGDWIAALTSEHLVPGVGRYYIAEIPA